MVLFFDLLGAILVSSILDVQENEGRGTLLSFPSSASNSFKYYSNRKGSRVVEVDWKNQCHVFDDGHAEWFRKTRADQMTILNYIQFHILLQKCDLGSESESGFGRSEPEDGLNNVNSSDFTNEHHLNKNKLMSMWNTTRLLPNVLTPPNDFGNHQALFNESDVTLFMEYSNATNASSGTPLIFPGTKWCGRGDIARSPEDLGIYTETDRCCREHDHCPKNIVARTTNFGLRNDGDYTRSHCECDQKFLKCLEKDRSLSALTSFKIANVYFNLLQPKCFDYRHPPVACGERRLSGDCITYKYDFQQPASYQFFPAQPYILREARKLFNTIFYGNTDLTRPIPTSIPLPNAGMITDVISNFPKPPPIHDNILGKTG